MTLREARCAFSAALIELLTALPEGCEFAFDEVTERLTEKDPTSDHMAGSLHHLGLAADILLYFNGKYATQTESYTFLGEKWEAIGRRRNLPLAWGGRFQRPDGNHFSLKWNGKA
jgi:hypothetical protein